jgi:hypothetical protein
VIRKGYCLKYSDSKRYKLWLTLKVTIIMEVVVMKIYYSKNISWQLIDNQIFIIDEVTKKEFTLKEIGKEFWILIKSHNLYKEIVEILSEQYDVANDIITSDLKEFVEDLISKKLLTKGEDCYES